VPMIEQFSDPTALVLLGLPKTRAGAEYLVGVSGRTLLGSAGVTLL
jgi:hypothetical protein